MITSALKLAWAWPRMIHNDDILDRCGLVNFAYVKHIQLYLPLLTMLTKCLDQDYCIFHQSTGEMIVILLDVYQIWHIAIKGNLVM